AVRRPRDCSDLLGVSLEQLSAARVVLRIPHTQRLVEATRGDPPPVWRPGHTPNLRAGVTVANGRRLRLADVPDKNTLVIDSCNTQAFRRPSAVLKYSLSGVRFELYSRRSQQVYAHRAAA